MVLVHGHTIPELPNLEAVIVEACIFGVDSSIDISFILGTGCGLQRHRWRMKNDSTHQTGRSFLALLLQILRWTYRFSPLVPLDPPDPRHEYRDLSRISRMIPRDLAVDFENTRREGEFLVEPPANRTES